MLVDICCVSESSLDHWLYVNSCCYVCVHVAMYNIICVQKRSCCYMYMYVFIYYIMNTLLATSNNTTMHMCNDALCCIEEVQVSDIHNSLCNLLRYESVSPEKNVCKGGTSKSPLLHHQVGMPLYLHGSMGVSLPLRKLKVL